MPAVSASSSVEKILLPEADQHDLKKSKKKIFWENRKCVLLCVLIYFCSFFSGYEHSVSGAFINYASFIEKFGEEFHGKKEIGVSLQQGIRVWFSIGAILANSVQWWLSDRFLGRIRTAQCGLVISILAIVLHIVAPNQVCFCAGRFFLGMGDAAVRYGTFLWVTESAVAPIRAASSGMWTFKMVVGGLMGLLVSRTFSKGNSPNQYRIPLIIGLAPQVVSILVLFLIPDSPRYLVMRGKTDAARRTLRLIRNGEHASEDAIDAEIRAIETALEFEKKTAGHNLQSLVSGEGSFWTRFKQSQVYAAFVGSNKRRMLVCAAAGTIYVSSGFDYTITGFIYILRTMGEHDPFKYSIIIACLCIVGSAVHFFYIAEALGRRTILLLGLSIAGCCMFSIGVGFVTPGVAIEVQRKVLIAFVTIAATSNCTLIVNIAHVMANEVPAQEFRSLGVSLHWIVFFLSTTVHDVIQPYYINVTKLNLRGKIAWLYVGLCIIAITFCYFLFPESRGVSLEEMDLLYNSGVPARKSAKWVKEHRRRVLGEKSATPSANASAQNTTFDIHHCLPKRKTETPLLGTSEGATPAGAIDGKDIEKNPIETEATKV